MIRIAYRCKQCGYIHFARKSMRKHIREVHGVKCEKKAKQMRDVAAGSYGEYVSPVTATMERVKFNEDTKMWEAINKNERS